MNAGTDLLKNAIDAGMSDMVTFLYAGAAIVVLLALAMVKVSLNNAKHRSYLGR